MHMPLRRALPRISLMSQSAINRNDMKAVLAFFFIIVLSCLFLGLMNQLFYQKIRSGFILELAKQVEFPKSFLTVSILKALPFHFTHFGACLSSNRALSYV